MTKKIIRRVEKIRFDLSTRVAALQEKVVNAQSDLSKERDARRAERDESETKEEQWNKERENLTRELQAALKVN